jgi:hypothetical protein
MVAMLIQIVMTPNIVFATRSGDRDMLCGTTGRQTLALSYENL